MNLKRHHVLYALLAVCLIAALIVLLAPPVPSVSYTAPGTASSTGTSSSTISSSQTVGPIHFEVVTTTTAQQQGLGGRPNIPENYAMLFVFPKDERIGFWMKDMLVPVDILWLSDNGTILGYEDSLSPDTYPQAFYPPQPVKYVLEMRAGETRRRGWKVGTVVTLPAL